MNQTAGPSATELNFKIKKNSDSVSIRTINERQNPTRKLMVLTRVSVVVELRVFAWFWNFLKFLTKDPNYKSTVWYKKLIENFKKWTWPATAKKSSTQANLWSGTARNWARQFQPDVWSWGLGRGSRGPGLFQEGMKRFKATRNIVKETWLGSTRKMLLSPKSLQRPVTKIKFLAD